MRRKGNIAGYKCRLVQPRWKQQRFLKNENNFELATWSGNPTSGIPFIPRKRNTNSINLFISSCPLQHCLQYQYMEMTYISNDGWMNKETRYVFSGRLFCHEQWENDASCNSGWILRALCSVKSARQRQNAVWSQFYVDLNIHTPTHTKPGLQIQRMGWS